MGQQRRLATSLQSFFERKRRGYCSFPLPKPNREHGINGSIPSNGLPTTASRSKGRVLGTESSRREFAPLGYLSSQGLELSTMASVIFQPQLRLDRLNSLTRGACEGSLACSTGRAFVMGQYNGALHSAKLWSSSVSNTLSGVSRAFYFQTASNLIGRESYSTESRPNESLAEDSSDSFGAAEVAARGWQITEESESDWRGHAAAIARSIQLMKTRMEWATLLSRLRQLDAELLKPDLWSNPSSASKISRERGRLAGRVRAVKDMETELVEHIGMAELAKEEKDSQVEADAKEALGVLRKVAKEKELAALLSGEHDECSCYLEVQAGAGGVESMDWAAMMLRMYRMWAMNRNYEVSTVEEMFGEEAGIKRGTIRLDGQFAYGYAKSEAGVHRLVRISPFDAGKRRHTSFAAVAVMPVLDESAIKIEIDESDLRIERYRAGGAGGQHVNKTESAVRIVHLPTGIVVQCQADRSQHRNKATALGVLQSRLYQMETARRAQATAQHTETLGDITWGSQIRSYVLQPYQMVKDLRTGYEESDPATVLDGDLDSFILSYLASQVRDSGPMAGA